MATQTSLPLPQTLASDMTLFELDETLCLLMESATETAEANNGEIPDELAGNVAGLLRSVRSEGRQYRELHQVPRERCQERPARD